MMVVVLAVEYAEEKEGGGRKKIKFCFRQHARAIEHFKTNRLQISENCFFFFIHTPTNARRNKT